MSDLPKAKVQLNGEFSALELEEIIRHLAQARASLEPPVPFEPPTEASEGEVLVQDNTQYSLRTLAGGGIRIWLRSEGFGWQAFTLSAASKNGLVEFLRKQIGHTHTSH